MLVASLWSCPIVQFKYEFNRITVIITIIIIQEVCQTVAIVLHYLFLVAFMWMLMEGVVLYVVLVRVFIKREKLYMLAFTLVSYGLPAFYLLLTVPLGLVLKGGDNNTFYGPSEDVDA